MWDRLLVDCNIATMDPAVPGAFGAIENGAIGIQDGRIVRVGRRTELAGFQDIESWYAAGGRQRLEPARHDQLLQQIGAMLARMNLARWQHGCLYAKHVFVKVTDDTLDVALLDLEKSRRRWTRRGAARHDLRQLRRHSWWSAAEWQQVLYGYEQVFGSTIKRLL